MTRPHCQTTCKYIKRGLNELRTNWHRKKSEHEEDDHKGIRVPVATVHPQLWNPTRLESLPDLEETCVARLIQNKTSPIVALRC